jgi:hypothetical protein
MKDDKKGNRQLATGRSFFVVGAHACPIFCGGATARAPTLRDPVSAFVGPNRVPGQVGRSGTALSRFANVWRTDRRPRRSRRTGERAHNKIVQLTVARSFSARPISAQHAPHGNEASVRAVQGVRSDWCRGGGTRSSELPRAPTLTHVFALPTGFLCPPLRAAPALRM